MSGAESWTGSPMTSAMAEAVEERAAARDETASAERMDAGPGWSEDLETSVFGETTWTIPGFGVQGDRCGEWFPKSFCDAAAESWATNGETHDPVNLGRHTCGRRGCPRCWSSEWARPRTVSAVARLGAARHLSSQHPRAVHVSISPPEGSVTSIREFYEARTHAVELALEHGIRGGLVVPHGWRVTDDAKDAFHEEDPEGGIWRWIRENETHWRSQVKWSPHFHVIGLSADVAESSPEDDDGWVVKNIKRGESHSLEPFHLTRDEGYEDMARTVRYLLSHATFQEDTTRQVMTWFGELHSTNFCPDPEAAKERKTEPEYGPLSAGSWETIQRKAEEIVGGVSDVEEDGAGGEDEELCDVDGCDGHVHPIWDVPAFVEQRGDNLTVEAMVRLRTAFDWAIGDVEEAPPDGWPHPRSEEDALGALDELV